MTKLLPVMGLETFNLFHFINIAMCENIENQSPVPELSCNENDKQNSSDSEGIPTVTKFTSDVDKCNVNDIDNIYVAETNELKNSLKLVNTCSETVKCHSASSSRGDCASFPYGDNMTICNDTTSNVASERNSDTNNSLNTSSLDSDHMDSGVQTCSPLGSESHSEILSDSFRPLEEMNNCNKLQTYSQYPQHPPDNDCTQDITTSSTIKQDVVISPVTLKQDLQLSLDDNKNRMSQVLENISLVYLPNTKQLISKIDTLLDKSSDSSEDNHSDPSSTVCSNNVDDDNDYKYNLDYTHSVLYGDSNVECDLLDSPQSEASLSAQLETSDLLGTKDEDQLTCHSLELCISRNASDSLLRTFNDNSSLSSLSTYTDISISTASAIDEVNGLSLDTDEAAFMDVNLHARNSFERTKNSEESDFEEKGAKTKKRGLSGFISRNLFSRKKDNPTIPGWKLFGKIPPKHGSLKEPSQICAEYQARQRTSQTFPPRNRKHNLEVLSTTALILENRPMNLPSKDPEEAERHRQEYEEMVEAARRKEQKELKQKKKRMQRQLKQEDLMVASVKIWNSEILPNWDNLWESKRAHDLCWLGIPPSVRGKVWQLAIGNELNVTPELYEICVSRAEDKIKELNECELMGTSETSSEPPSSKEASVELIKLDVSRTFPQLCIFQKGGPYHDILQSLLGAYVCYRPDVGYVQGMSFIAAVLLLNMDVADSFICFSNLLNRPCQVAFFRVDETLMKAYFNTFEEFLNENLPNIHSLFRKLSITPDLFIIDWIFTLFTRPLPLDVACRVWDNFCRDGEEFLFRTAIGILKMFEEVLMNMDFIHLVQFLTRLPEDINGDCLFRNIDDIKMNIDKKKFSQVLVVNRDKELS